MEVVISIAAKIAEYTVEPVGRWLCYSFQYGSNIENLKNWIKELQGARDRVKHDIDAARRNAEEIETDVNSWLEKVDEIIHKAEEVLENEDKGKLRFANGEFLNLKQRHQLGRKAKKIVKAIDDDKILEKGKFDRVGHRPPSEGIMTSTSYLEFESRQSIKVDLKEALKDTNINMIGVWGMGGIGKTTLVTEVSGQAKGEKLFSEVAMADVGQSPNIIRIQGEIADGIGLKLDGEAEVGRAKHLRERLKKDTKILLVLDNIWKRLDLNRIGIPCEGSKVILISRDREVLRQMDTRKYFGLEPLSEKEGWNLVVKTLGNSVDGSEFQEIATELVKKCDGLPVALEAVFKALKDKSIEEWKEALQRWKATLQRLQTSTPGIPIDVEFTIYSCIELSYNQLKRREDKDFFLQCAQMPDPNSQMDLLRNCYGLGLFSGINTLEGARNTVWRLLRCLKDSGLLQDCSAVRGCEQGSEHFHMHDVVRDVARSIASTDHNMILVRDGDLRREWPTEYVLKGCEALSIDARDIHKIPNKMEFPELKLFSVTGTIDSLQISDTLFQGMEQLRVLEFKSVQLLSVPPSVTLLTNLRTLKLDYCWLTDITIIGKLKNLAILSLRGNRISEFPKEIGSLINLQLLDLSWSSDLEVIPPDILSNLKELEELYMGNTFIKWKAEGVNNERNSASLIELNHLLRLVTLEIDIKDASYLPNDLLFPKLERYKIFVGDGFSLYERSKTLGFSRILDLKNISSCQLETVFRNLLKGTESLLLTIFGDTCVPHKLDREDFQHLKYLEINNSPRIEYVSDSRMSKCFDKLRVVEIYDCEKLKYFISLSIARGLSQLEKLEIRCCSNMVAVFVKEGEIEDRHMTLFPKLRCLKLDYLPMLKSFLSLQNPFAIEAGEIMSEDKLDCGSHTTTDPFFTEVVAFPNLEDLIICNVVELKIIWPSHFPMDCFCKLEKIHIEFCENLTSIFQSNMLARFQNLKELCVKKCDSLEQVFDLEGLNVEESHTETVIQLKKLIVHGLPKLRHVWNKDPSRFFSFQNLREVEALNCQSLKSLFPASVARHLTQLENLVITECGVEEIVAREEAEQPGDQIIFPQVKFLHLEDLPRLKQFLLGVHATRDEGSVEECQHEIHNEEVHSLFDKVAFPNLEDLIICNVVELKIIWPSHFPMDCFCKLEKIHIEFCENLTSIFQSNMLARFQNLKELCVRKCDSLEQVFDLEGLNVEESHTETVIQLKTLIVHGLPKLRHVWNKDPSRFFSFQNLREVEALNCQSLKSLFPASVARHLTQLENLFIIRCGVEEIVAREEVEQPRDQIIFPQVKFLHLEHLPRLKQFLLGVHVTRAEGSVEECQHEICNEEVHSLFDKVAFPNLEKFKICNVVELKIIWPSHFPIGSFCKLKEIHIKSCENLTSIFHSNMLERFLDVEKLSVENCGSLEQVFDFEGLNVEESHTETVIQLKKLIVHGLPKLRHVWNKDPSRFFSFQNLREVKAIDCQSLKSLFPASVARHLTQLENLVITECGVEEIVAGDEAAQATDRLIFPQVKYLRIGYLPRLERFHPGVHTSVWPKLELIWVKRCPFVCVPKSKEGKLEKCQPETCDKRVHFLFNTNQEVTVGTEDDEDSFSEDSLLEYSFSEDLEEEED